MSENQEQQVSLGLSDLALMANIIQVTTQRGAIKAEEMETVGMLYKKLANFVQANTPQTNDENSEQNENVDTNDTNNGDQ